MKINPEIINIVKKETENTDEGILYLISVFFKIKYNFNEDLMNLINSLKIFEIKNGKLKWNLPLFVERNKTDYDEEELDFIERYRNLWKNIDISKAGSRSVIIKKIEEFKKKNPDISDEDILEAAQMYIEEYLANNSSTKFLTQADYFISKYDPNKTSYTSKLELYLDILKEKRNRIW